MFGLSDAFGQGTKLGTSMMQLFYLLCILLHLALQWHLHGAFLIAYL
jgi:hypothetical protein